MRLLILLVHLQLLTPSFLFPLQSWTFRHPDFHADRRDALENIKRKVPAARKSSSTAALNTSLPPSSTHPLSSHPYRRSPSPISAGGLSGHTHSHGHSLINGGSHSSGNTAALNAEIQRLKDESDDLRGRIRSL